MKYKKGEWVTIIKERYNSPNFLKYIGETYPVLEVYKIDSFERVNLPTKFKNLPNMIWALEEVQRATPKEIERAKLKLCAEAL